MYIYIYVYIYIYIVIPQTKEARLGWGSYLVPKELPLEIRFSRRRRHFFVVLVLVFVVIVLLGGLKGSTQTYIYIYTHIYI